MPPPEVALAGEPEPIFELAAEPAGTEELEATADMSAEEPLEDAATSTSAPVTEAAHEPRPGSQPSVQKAIEEVSGIVEALRGTLDAMEEMLEMLELFERQQNADEREIESLRRALRQMQRPRDGGHQRR
jgi:hypothetical protein